MITRKKLLIGFPRVPIMIAIGTSAFAAGVFFAFPSYRQDFAKIEFMQTSVIAEVADTPTLRTQGLSGRLSMPDSSGMLFVMDKPEYIGIWMKDMKFPIDILWMRNGAVVDMKENVQPPAPRASFAILPVYHPAVKSDFVLELNAGFSRTHAIHIGDRVSIELNGRLHAYAKTDDDGETHLFAEASSTSVAGSEYTIDTLRNETLTGNDFRVGEKIAANEIYNTYGVSYRSGDLTISGVMNVPQAVPPSDGFPVLVLNHGLIPPPIYTTGRGSRREQDFFARRGYVTIHPDYRGHASSSPNLALHHDFYVGYTQDVLALLDAIKRTTLPYIDAHRIGVWGHSMGGGITARVMVLHPEVKAFVLFAPISADVEDNFYELTPEEIQWLHNTYGSKGDPVYRKISPIEYFKDVSAPVQIHHGTADTAVPLIFSEKIYEALKKNQKQVEFFIYPGEKHEFINDWSMAANRALQFFDAYVKK